MRHLIETMGTVAGIDLPEDLGELLTPVKRIFAQTEALFSLHRPDSELSRVARGELSLTSASATVRDTYARAVHWRSATDGYFSPNRPDGAVDLNGIVKAEAIEAAAGALAAAGCPWWSINVGGDILISADAPGPLRAIGLADPADAAALLGSVVLAGTRRAIATSGSAQRGDHIWRGGQSAPTPFVQVTVIADDIVTADVLATAIVAGGHAALADLTARFDVDVLTVDHQGDLLATPGTRTALTPASPHPT